MSPEPTARCARCGKDLKPGELKFILRLSVTADFDGYLRESDTGGLDAEALLQQLAERSSTEMEDEVSMERAFLLCPNCRTAVLADPLGTGEDDSSPGWVT